MCAYVAFSLVCIDVIREMWGIGISARSNLIQKRGLSYKNAVGWRARRPTAFLYECAVEMRARDAAAAKREDG